MGGQGSPQERPGSRTSQSSLRATFQRVQRPTPSPAGPTLRISAGWQSRIAHSESRAGEIGGRRMITHGSLRARHGAGSARLFVLALVAALGMAHALPASAPAQVAPAQVAPALLSGPPLTPVATALASPHVPGVVLVGFYSGVSRARQHA